MDSSEDDKGGSFAATAHGARKLPAVIVDTYNEELRDEEEFVGDRASGRAFHAILDDWRERVASSLDEDPFGDTPTGKITEVDARQGPGGNRPGCGRSRPYRHRGVCP